MALSDSGEDDEEDEEDLDGGGGRGGGGGEIGEEQPTFRPVPPSFEPPVRQRGTKTESTREFFEI